MRLLIIDDEPALLELLRRYLMRLGYDVETFAAAEDALARFQAEPAAFSMAITDLSLPGMNGEDLIRKLRERRPRLPAIITSGYPYQPRSADIGFLQKPFLPQAMAEKIKEALKDPV